MAVAKGRTYVGTSGWSYDHWQGRFYPKNIPRKEWFEYYCQQFQTVEINNTFYNLPGESTFKDWHERTPPDFLFSVKASRYITHMKKLKDPEEPVRNFMKRVKLLRSKLGPILFQLPPGWKHNTERLEIFLELLPKGKRYTFEFRDNSWWINEVYELLKKHKCSFCIFDLEGRLSPKEITSDFIYIRLHGPDEAYQGSYTNRKLNSWAGNISDWNEQGFDVFCYFDNDERGYAAENARTLRRII
jgi:uncharacterized protein YecE (DUF72 family)